MLILYSLSWFKPLNPEPRRSIGAGSGTGFSRIWVWNGFKPNPIKNINPFFIVSPLITFIIKSNANKNDPVNFSYLFTTPLIHFPPLNRNILGNSLVV